VITFWTNTLAEETADPRGETVRTDRTRHRLTAAVFAAAATGLTLISAAAAANATEEPALIRRIAPPPTCRVSTPKSTHRPRLTCSLTPTRTAS
jgi:hypothetical protein